MRKLSEEGRGLAAGTAILMADSTTKSIENIAVGDMVQTEKGASPVAAVTALGEEEVFRIETSVNERLKDIFPGCDLAPDAHYVIRATALHPIRGGDTDTYYRETGVNEREEELTAEQIDELKGEENVEILETAPIEDLPGLFRVKTRVSARNYYTLAGDVAPYGTVLRYLWASNRYMTLCPQTARIFTLTMGF